MEPTEEGFSNICSLIFPNHQELHLVSPFWATLAPCPAVPRVPQTYRHGDLFRPRPSFVLLITPWVGSNPQWAPEQSFFFFFCGEILLGFELGFGLARQLLYCCALVILREGLNFCPGKPKLWPSYFILPTIAGMTGTSLCPAIFCWDGISQTLFA
jgi:hypothetical protein